jgi:hypothetical protein
MLRDTGAKNDFMLICVNGRRAMIKQSADFSVALFYESICAVA